MTSQELLEDLKQFVRGTVSQAVSGLATQADLDALNRKVDGLASKVDGLATDLRAEMSELHDQVIEGMNQQTETIVAAIEATDRRQTVRMDDHETRISRLEHHAF